MSADNYYVIKKHPKGGYAAVMGFASNEALPEVRDRHRSFVTVEQAISWATNEYSEYGVSVDPEVLDEILWTDRPGRK